MTTMVSRLLHQRSSLRALMEMWQRVAIFCLLPDNTSYLLGYQQYDGQRKHQQWGYFCRK